MFVLNANDDDILSLMKARDEVIEKAQLLSLQLQKFADSTGLEPILKLIGQGNGITDMSIGNRVKAATTIINYFEDTEKKEQ